MRTFFILMIMTLTSCIGIAQALSCKEMLIDATTEMEVGKYGDAMQKFQAARKCDPRLSQEVDQKIVELFEKINSLKNKIEEERNTAQLAQKLAEQQKQKAQENAATTLRLISGINDILQMEENKFIIGFETLEDTILKRLEESFLWLLNKSDLNISLDEISRIYLQQSRAQWAIADPQYSTSVFLALKISSEAILTYLNAGQEVPEETILTYLDASAFVSSDLLSMRKIAECNQILNDANRFLSQQSISSARFFASKARLCDVNSSFCFETKDFQCSITKQMDAIDFIQKAIDIDSTNINYLAWKADYLRSLYILPDSLFSDKKKLVRQGCECADSIHRLPGSGMTALYTLTGCIYDRSLEKIDGMSNKTKIDSLESGISELKKFVHLAPKNKDLYLQLAFLQGRVVQIIREDSFSKKYEIPINYNKANYVEAAKSNLAKYVSGKPFTPSAPWKVKLVYEIIRDNSVVPSLADTSAKTPKSGIASVFEPTAFEFSNNPKIAAIAADIYTSLAEERAKLNFGYDTAIRYIDSAITHFGRAGILQDTAIFYEDYSWYCGAYSTRIQLHCQNNKIDAAIRDFKTMEEKFGPILQKYPFDFYLRDKFNGAHKRIGELLCKNEKYSEAITYLEKASHSGNKQSTQLLASIYREGKIGNKNIPLADSLEKLASKQSLKKFTIPCQFGNIQAPFDVYVAELPIDFPFKGIDDQAKWLFEARGGIVPEKVTSSFRKLQELAWKNDVSYPDLCVYALKEANKDKFEENLAKMNLPIADQIQKYDAYLDSCSAESKKSSNGQKSYTYSEQQKRYIAFMLKNGEFERAKNVAGELVMSDPNDDSFHIILADVHIAEYESAKLRNINANPDNYLTSTGLEERITYYEYFLKKTDSKACLSWQKKILASHNSFETRNRLLQLQENFGIDLTKDLYSDQSTDTIRKDINTLAAQARTSKTNDESLVIYESLVKLDNLLGSKQWTANTVANHYGNLAWHQLLAKKFKESQKSCETGLKIDPQNPYANSNLPHSLLCQGEYEKASKLYLELKNKKFDTGKRYPTYKEAFIADFELFQNDGVVPKLYQSDMEAIIDLLKK